MSEWQEVKFLPDRLNYKELKGGINIMSDRAEGILKCQSCGGEAELFIEDASGSKKKVGTLVCKTCGFRESVTLEKAQDERLTAVKIAVEAEREAFLFYRSVSEKSSNPRGKDMFQQLAEFEMEHYKKMIHLYLSLKRENKWIPYTGVGELKAQHHIEVSTAGVETNKNDIEALKIAIEKETQAAAFYRKMAEETKDPLGQEMFKKLTEEEEIHRRLLNDQFYSLQNQGEWVWGD